MFSVVLNLKNNSMFLIWQALLAFLTLLLCLGVTWGNRNFGLNWAILVVPWVLWFSRDLSYLSCIVLEVCDIRSSIDLLGGIYLYMVVSQWEVWYRNYKSDQVWLNNAKPFFGALRIITTDAFFFPRKWMLASIHFFGFFFAHLGKLQVK